MINGNSEKATTEKLPFLKTTEKNKTILKRKQLKNDSSGNKLSYMYEEEETEKGQLWKDKL